LWLTVIFYGVVTSGYFAETGLQASDETRSLLDSPTTLHPEAPSSDQ
jgi:hypothetical protein